MAHRLPRLLAIMGSGETSPTMSGVHRDLFARLDPPPVPAVLLDTPFGFQENADDISARAVAYFRESVGREVTVATYRSADSADPLQYETMLARVRDAAYVFAGPGSPSYALKEWAGTQLPVALSDTLRAGGCITFASAAAVTMGPLALPVYEIYKVGQAPHWLEGLDLMSDVGLRAVVVPHFDNAEGGTHDTRYCYMGERRLARLEAMLPDDTFILGVDEHTVCVIDLDQDTAAVSGLGATTVRKAGRMTRFPAGDTVPLEALRQAARRRPGTSTSGAAARHGREGTDPRATGAPAARSPFKAETARLEAEFAAALEARDAPTAVRAALDLEALLVEWSRDTLQSDERDRARAALRSTLVRLGEAAQEGLRDPRQVVGPFVEALLAVRRRARADGRWAEADAVRADLAAAGVEVRDGPVASDWRLAPLP